MNSYTFKGSNSASFIMPLLLMSSTLEVMNLLLQEQILTCKSKPHFGIAMLSRKTNSKSKNLSPFETRPVHVQDSSLNSTLPITKALTKTCNPEADSDTGRGNNNSFSCTVLLSIQDIRTQILFTVPYLHVLYLIFWL